MFRYKMFLKRKFERNKKIITAFAIVFACFIVGAIGFAYYYTIGDYQASGQVQTPSFGPIINGSTNINQVIDLENTITNYQPLAPNAMGEFNIGIDFTNVDTDVYYRIDFTRDDIPNNLKIYTDSSYTQELTYIDGTHYKNDSNIDNYIYWKWIYEDSTSSNDNDNLYMNREISLPFTVYVSQNTNRGNGN